MQIIGRLGQTVFLCAVTYRVPSIKLVQRQKHAFSLEATLDIEARIRNGRNNVCEKVKSLLRIQYF